jgi:hypothetical protein
MTPEPRPLPEGGFNSGVNLIRRYMNEQCVRCFRFKDVDFHVFHLHVVDQDCNEGDVAVEAGLICKSCFYEVDAAINFLNYYTRVKVKYGIVEAKGNVFTSGKDRETARNESSIDGRGRVEAQRAATGQEKPKTA